MLWRLPGRAASRVDQSEVAAVDLGSNSFHMIVAQPQGNTLRVVDRLRESVRLAAGLDADKNLDEQARARALECLQRLGDRVRNLPAGAVRAVGTNTLRQSRNARAFLRDAEQALGHPIQIVSGFEEARLIYLGVAHSIADDDERRLVIDIGGGSTEFIIGEHFIPRAMESLHMGCVSATRAHFADGQISKERFKRAEISARRELEPIAERYQQLGWARVIGASGTIKTIERCLREQGWTQTGIDMAGLEQLRRTLIKAGSVQAINLSGLSADRAEILPGGVAVLLGAFQQLGLTHMDAADGALREGLLFDLLGRIDHEDVRGASIAELSRRYHADPKQAERVVATANALHAQVAGDWMLEANNAPDMLAWAAQVHEVGLDISHSQYHKHSEYIVRHADLAGFTREEQQVLAALVRVHRRKFSRAVFKDLPEDWQRPAMRLAVLLRLAITLHRGRSTATLPALSLQVDQASIALRFPAQWLDQHALVEADLDDEVNWLAAADFDLRIIRGE